ncbi:MAG: type II/IV secretion system protein [Ruminococcaceae bacterium]|nr:type II/IV secretion system protein [Oscillospiraceae bacterium]
MAFMKRNPAQKPAEPAEAPEIKTAPNETAGRALIVPEVQTVNLAKIKVAQSVLALIPEAIATANKMLPLYLTNRDTTLVVAMADPRNDDAINNIGVYTGLSLEAMYAPAEVIEEKIRELYTTQRAYSAAKELVSSVETTEESDLGNDESVPIVRFVNNMIEEAILMKASDIHIEPQEHLLRIRFRVDGKMVIYMDTGVDLGPSVASRIKFISGLNIAERRIPQDGRINYNYGKGTVDLRISILPGAFGETIVMRITTALSFNLNINSIGFTEPNKKLFSRAISATHGLILLTGPTGSGKTTTLYSALSELNKPDVNIITVEDPVEMIMDNLTQVEVNAAAGLTFAKVMRSILRQDPDIVMVGEIRDEETAKIAMTLSITGHLVFSTLHTFDSPSAVMRLVDMGVEPYMVFSALSAVVSQRLVRRLCPHCRHAYHATDAECQVLGMPAGTDYELYSAEPHGCDACNGTGYVGRTAVHEILMMSPAIRDNLASGGNTETIRKIAKEEGMTTLLDNLKELVLDGTTSMEELRRTYSEVV